jgi:iron complex transport system permease protein
MKRSILFFSVCVLIILLVIANVLLGSVSLPVSDVVDTLLGGSAAPITTQNIILKSRLPQTLVAALSGAALAVSGLEMQTVFRNPLAGPTVLGISNGASLGVALVLLLGGNIAGVALSKMGLVGEMAITFSAIVGAMFIMLLIISVSRHVRSSVTLLVIGVMIGYVANALIGVLKFFSVEEDIRSYVVWGMGSFQRVSPEHFMPFGISIGVLLVLSLPLVKTLNLMLLGDSYARNLGLNLKRARLLVITSSGMLCAVTTAYCGPIAFLGLAVPHLCRGIIGTSDHRVLLPFSLLSGAVLALLCHLIARMPGFEGALPVNSVTALVGAPVIVSVLFRRRQLED